MTPDSTLSLLSLLRGMVGDRLDAQRLWTLEHPGPPISKGRPRFSPRVLGGIGRRVAAYTPERSAKAQTALAWRFTMAMMHEKTLTKPIAIVAQFYRPDLKRIDVDNLMKLVMDAATQARVWVDDSHVVAQAAFIELDRKHPRTLVAWCEVESSMDRRTG